jgi:4-amino-4-deoxy-L-arabinose transferase-like glycosyltransferase
MLAIVLPWAIAIALESHGAFYQRSLGHDFAAKMMAGQETHGAPPGYYLALAAITLWPATLFVLPAIGSAVIRRAEPAVRYLLAWIVPNWILFEAVPTKLPHYILPVYPALALLTALWIMRERGTPQPCWLRVLGTVSAILFVVVALAAGIAAVVATQRFGTGLSPEAMIGAASLLILILGAVLLQLRGHAPIAAVCALAGAFLLYPLLTSTVAPELPKMWMSNDVANHVAADRAPRDPPVILAGYLEPSLVFLLGTNTRLESAGQAGMAAARQGGLAIIGDRERRPFLIAIKKAGANAKSIDQVTGFDYSRGREMHVTFYRVTPAPLTKTPPGL